MSTRHLTRLKSLPLSWAEQVSVSALIRCGNRPASSLSWGVGHRKARRGGHLAHSEAPRDRLALHSGRAGTPIFTQL